MKTLISLALISFALVGCGESTVKRDEIDRKVVCTIGDQKAYLINHESFLAYSIYRAADSDILCQR